MLQFDVSELDEELALDDDLSIPRIRMTTHGLPEIHIQVGGEEYTYERSFPIKGHMASMPKVIRAAIAEGKQPLVIERPERFYVYYRS